MKRKEYNWFNYDSYPLGLGRSHMTDLAAPTLTRERAENSVLIVTILCQKQCLNRNHSVSETVFKS